MTPGRGPLCPEMPVKGALSKAVFNQPWSSSPGYWGTSWYSWRDRRLWTSRRLMALPGSLRWVNCFVPLVEVAHCCAKYRWSLHTAEVFISWLSLSHHQKPCHNSCLFILNEVAVSTMRGKVNSFTDFQQTYKSAIFREVTRCCCNTACVLPLCPDACLWRLTDNEDPSRGIITFNDEQRLFN